MTSPQNTPSTPSRELEILDILKKLGFVYSDENEAWMHSEFGMGFTSAIDVRVLKRIHDAILANYTANQKIVEALGKDEIDHHQDCEVDGYDHCYKCDESFKLDGRNQLRQEIHKKLNLEQSEEVEG